MEERRPDAPTPPRDPDTGPSAALADLDEAVVLARATRARPHSAVLVLALALVFGTGVVAMVGIMRWLATDSWLGAGIVGGLFGWPVGLMALIWLHGRIDRVYDRRPHIAELLRRAGWLPLDALADDARQRVTTMPGPGWLLAIHGRALPDWGQHFVRVELYEGEEHACCVDCASVRWPLPDPDAGDARDPRTCVQLRDGELTVDERDELLDLMHGAEREPVTGWPAYRVIDGYPFHVIAVRRGPGESFDYQGNLADPDAPAHARRLATFLLDIGHRLGAPRARYTSVDARGEPVAGER